MRTALHQPTDPPTTPIDLRHPSGPLPAPPRRDRGGVWLVVLVVASLLLAAVAGGLWWYRTHPPTTTRSTASTPSGATPAAPTTGTSAGPATTTADGRPLPAATVRGAQRVYEALAANDLTTLSASYAPDRAAGVAPWSRVAPRLAPREVRDGLLAALRTPPTEPAEVDYLFASGDRGVGLRADGRIAFLGTGQGRSSTGTAPTTGPDPVLGSNRWAPGVTGYGTARPREVNANGDGTSYVDDVTWRTWGGPTATGTGRAAYVPPDAPDNAHSVQARAEVIVSNLGTCDGKPAYLRITWYFPEYGETAADAGAGYDDICDGF